MTSSWQIRADSIAGLAGSVLAPQPWFEAYGFSPTHARISLSDSESEVLKLRPSGNPQGSLLVVAPGVLGLSDREEAPGDATPLTVGEYRRYWLTSTTAGRLTLLGLAMAVLGQLLQVGLDLGAEWVIFDIGSSGIAVTKAAKGLLTIGGLALAFWQGLLKGP